MSSTVPIRWPYNLQEVATACNFRLIPSIGLIRAECACGAAVAGTNRDDACLLIAAHYKIAHNGGNHEA